MCSLSCLSQWPNVLRRWRRVCWFFLTLNPFSRQRDGELGHRASLFSGAPCLPRPELFIRLGEVTHTSIIHSASPVSSYPCRRRCCENPKGGPLWARRSSRLTVMQHFATAAHCDGICISWIGNYQVVKRASLKEEMSLNPNWDFQPFCKWFSVCGSFFFSGAATLKMKTLQHPHTTKYEFCSCTAGGRHSTESHFVISSLNVSVKSLFAILIQLELSAISAGWGVDPLRI